MKNYNKDKVILVLLIVGIISLLGVRWLFSTEYINNKLAVVVTVGMLVIVHIIISLLEKKKEKDKSK